MIASMSAAKILSSDEKTVKRHHGKTPDGF